MINPDSAIGFDNWSLSNVGLLEAPSPSSLSHATLPYLWRTQAIGANGMIWVKAQSPVHTVLIANAIQNSEGLTGKQQQRMVRQLVRAVQQQQEDE